LQALLTLAVLSALITINLWLAIGEAAGFYGTIFALMIVYLMSMVFGEIASKIGTHPLCGMLVAGFVCRYIPGKSRWPSELRLQLFCRTAEENGTIFAIISIYLLLIVLKILLCRPERITCAEWVCLPVSHAARLFFHFSEGCTSIQSTRPLSFRGCAS
jgi:hypothetical protein